MDAGASGWVGRNLIGAEAMERYAANLATRGGVPWAILKHPANLNATQAQTFQNRWVESSQRRDGAPAVLSGGIELELLSLSPKDMALLELRQFDEGRICALLGVPPFLVGLPSGGDSMTYSNVSSLFDYHWRATLRPIAGTISDAMSNWALPGRTGLEFDRDEYVRPALGERAQAYSVLHGIVDNGTPAISVEEIRRAERFDTASATLTQPDPGDAAVVLTGGDH
jgi:HK97 family phage portal protein